ncbi:YafY family transcriptional regulator [Embleya sp. NBC_00888]|uniref:helix-turn-helix transcriptional regulator n=1 Tax=Embleya sp. NBC_00888 TaxID=2975960 RepID=UPI0038699452|nr:YafY family transcriptional regulator [Embleya sp. NBC_00888]
MLETSARLLRMLSLMQTRPDWTGPELAERLGVSGRTVRYDIERLRGLGYPVHARRGVVGGYRLGAGKALPPLLLDDEEAVSIVVGLRIAAGSVVDGMDEAMLRALAKLDQVLPSRLHRRVKALQKYTVPVRQTGPAVDMDVMTVLAGACRDHEQLRFRYSSHDGKETSRVVEPYRLVHRMGRWYLVAWDVKREDWRTFRMDRITPRPPHGPRFTPRELPADGDVAAFVNQGVQSARGQFRARVLVRAPIGTVAEKVPPAFGAFAVVDDDTCVFETSASSIENLAVYISLLDADFEIEDPPELVAYIRRLARRYGGATPVADAAAVIAAETTAQGTTAAEPTGPAVTTTADIPGPTLAPAPAEDAPAAPRQ